MSLFLNSLTNKINKDAQFGANTDFGRAFNETNNNTPQTSAALSEKAILDLDLIVEKWIAYMWENTSKVKQSSKQQALELEEIDILVNWNKVEICQDEAVFSDRKNLNKKLNQQTLFRTYFTNKTDKEQEYSFKTERVTRQSCSFSFLKGFSREKEGSISFKLPYDIVELAGGLRSEQVVECGKDKTNEEEITWGVDSNVKVAPFTKTTAELVINELELERDFFVATYLKGRVNVTLNSKKDNNTFLKSFNSDICQVFELAERKNWISRGNKVEILKHNGEQLVKIECAGKCKLRLGIEQHIDIKDEPLNK